MFRFALTCILIAVWIFLPAVTKPESIELQPGWVSNPQSEYPAEAYLSGIGIGATTSIAEKKALASLAQYFETSVTATSTSNEQERSVTKDNLSKSELQSSFASQIETFSSAKIQFAEVVQTWQNPSSKNYYVLMVIDKNKASEIYQSKIMDFEKILTLYNSETDNPLLRYAQLRKAAIASRESESYYYYYNALAPAKLPRITAEFSTGEIEALRNAAGQAISFDLMVKGDSVDIVLNAMQEMLRKQGFSYAPEAALCMHISIIPSAGKVMGKQIFAGYAATMKLYFQDKHVFSLTDQVQQGDTTLPFAQARAIKALSNSLCQKFKKEFNKYLEQI